MVGFAASVVYFSSSMMGENGAWTVPHTSACSARVQKLRPGLHLEKCGKLAFIKGLVDSKQLPTVKIAFRCVEPVCLFVSVS